MTHGADKDAGRRKACWREADLRRALAVARKAHLDDYRVELAPDGTIAIVVGSGQALAARRKSGMRARR